MISQLELTARAGGSQRRDDHHEAAKRVNEQRVACGAGSRQSSMLVVQRP
jgi:hypothetical protein